MKILLLLFVTVQQTKCDVKVQANVLCSNVQCFHMTSGRHFGVLTIPVMGVESFSYAKIVFSFNKFAELQVTSVKRLYEKYNRNFYRALLSRF